MHWLSRNTRLADSTARQWTVNSYKTETSAVSRQNKTKKQTKISPVFPHLLLFCKTIVLFSRNLVHIHILWLWLLWSSHASNVVSCSFFQFHGKGLRQTTSSQEMKRAHAHMTKWRQKSKTRHFLDANEKTERWQNESRGNTSASGVISFRHRPANKVALFWLTKCKPHSVLVWS